ncbi:MAG TPA: hypothetical protein VKT78_11735, partial [Fimbriimonadaceae bacterium]|nr:hypothetical protein [Fimbriimonadaceae bacterium]
SGGRLFSLPFLVDDSLTVSHAFNILPLTPALAPPLAFYILVLDKHEIRLIHSRDMEWEHIGLGDFAGTIEAFCHAESRGDSHQQHVAGPGHQTAIGPGGTDHDAVEKARTRRYFVALDHKVVEVLSAGREPLILAGPADAQALYRDLTRYPHVAKTGIGAQHPTPDDELHRSATQIAQLIADQARKLELNRYRLRAGTGLTSQQIEEILVASNTGKIESLLISGAVPIWGKFDEVTGTTRISDSAGSTDEDLVNLAAINTIRHRGSIFPVKEGELDLVGSTAAVFRF